MTWRHTSRQKGARITAKIRSVNKEQRGTGHVLATRSFKYEAEAVENDANQQREHKKSWQ